MKNTKTKIFAAAVVAAAASAQAQYATQSWVQQNFSTIASVTDLRNKSVVFNAVGGTATLPNSASINFVQNASNGFGAFLNGNNFGIYSGGDNGSIFFTKNPSALGLNLSYSNRGGSGNIFTSTLSGVTFPGSVNVGTPGVTVAKDGTTGFGSYLSATNIGFYSGGDNGSLFFKKNPAALGISLSYSNRGGSGDIFTTTLTSTSFTGSVNVGGDLYVKGRYIAMGIPVSNVADYVFEPEYKLASLSEVEAYTRQNKHLPGVPSAKEISEGGLDITEMNLTLLKKVEELTLHVIAQQKEIDGLKRKTQGL